MGLRPVTAMARRPADRAGAVRPCSARCRVRGGRR